jgi:hypothetical protein
MIMNLFKKIIDNNELEYKLFLESSDAFDLVDDDFVNEKSSRNTEWNIFKVEDLQDIQVGDTVYLVDYYGDNVDLNKPVVVKSFDAAQKVFENTCRWKYEELRKNGQSTKAVENQRYEKKIYYDDDGKFIGIRVVKVEVS